MKKKLYSCRSAYLQIDYCQIVSILANFICLKLGEKTLRVSDNDDDNENDNDDDDDDNDNDNVFLFLTSSRSRSISLTLLPQMPDLVKYFFFSRC